MSGRSILDVAFVVPQSGPSGIFGPSCEASARLAASEINEAGGVLGREMRLLPVDGGEPPARVAARVGAMADAGEIEAVVGWHTSAVRERVAPRLAGRLPYVYTAVYEGGEQTPGVFLTGETPATQLLPAMRWMAGERSVRRWFVVGSDYIWPRTSAGWARRFAGEVGAEIVDEAFVGLGTEEFGPVLRRIERARPQGILLLLLGSDAVQFNRAFTEMRLHELMVRLSPLMDENMLLATGPANTHELYSVAGFFESLGTAHSMDFGSRYRRRLGPNAPVTTSPGESCFEGVTLLSRLAAAARDTGVGAVDAISEGLAYEGPRGRVHLHDRHLQQRIYLAQADGLDFDVLSEVGTDS